MSEYAVALAAADRQLALVKDTLTETVGRATTLLSQHDETGAWALLTAEIARQLDCQTKYQKFASELLAAAAIRLAQAA